jgi:hypothetical protein
MAGELETTGGRLDGLLRLLFWGGAALLWLLPLAAMQVTAEVDWTTSDFVIWGVMLLIAAGVCELALRASGDLAFRAGVVVAVGAAFLLVWINLAVGIIGSEDESANLMYFGVIAVAAIGALMAGFRPAGMARALVATAVAQALVGVLALAAGWGAGSENWPQPIVVLSGVFAALWLLSAWLFRKAARNRTADGAAA